MVKGLLPLQKQDDLKNTLVSQRYFYSMHLVLQCRVPM